MSFNELLDRSGITKAELARRLGLTANAVSKWGNSPPGYASAYVELLIQSREMSVVEVREVTHGHAKGVAIMLANGSCIMSTETFETNDQIDAFARGIRSGLVIGAAGYRLK